MSISINEYNIHLHQLVANCKNQEQLLCEVITQISNLLKCKATIVDKNGINILLIEENNSLNINESSTNIPLNYCGINLGSAIYCKNGSFSDDELLIIDMSSLVICLILSQVMSKSDDELERSISIVKSAIGTLSYSELEAILFVFEELGSDEGIIIASKIAGKNGVTRSVIVNGLRKLESAEIIISKSLGMKGTYVKINNKYFIDELKSAKGNFSRFS